MDNKYQFGKIYIGRSINEPNKVYIGSTVQPLLLRQRVHISEWKHDVKKCMSNELIATGSFEMHLYEDFPCNSKTELERREGEVMLEFKKRHKEDPTVHPDITNKRIAGRTKKELYAQEKVRILATQKKMFDADPEKFRARKRADYAKDPEKYKARTRKNMEDPKYRANKAALCGRPWTCPICGDVGTFNKRKRHMKTVKCNRVKELAEMKSNDLK